MATRKNIHRKGMGKKMNLNLNLNQREKVSLGFILGAMGIVVISAALYHWNIKGEQPFPVELLIMPALLGMIGVSALFFETLENHFDMKNEDKSTFYQPSMQNMVSILCSFLQICLVIGFRKWEAEWSGWMNVSLVAAVLAAAISLIVISSDWFQVRRRYTKPWVFYALLCAFLLSTFLGMFFTQPVALNGSSAMELGQYQDSRSQTLFVYLFDRDCYYDCDLTDGWDLTWECEGVFCLPKLTLTLLGMTVMAPATIQHFWVVSSTWLLLVLWLLSLRGLSYYFTPHRSSLQRNNGRDY